MTRKLLQDKLICVIAICLAFCFTALLAVTSETQQAHADGTDGVTVRKVNSESELTVSSLYAFTPTWQSDSVMTPYGDYEYTTWDPYGGGVVYQNCWWWCECH